jgi:hypothetical protein
MRHRRDDLRGRVARQLRVGVERDDVAHGRQRAGVADDALEAIGAAFAGVARAAAH